MGDPNTSTEPADVEGLVATLNDLLVNLRIPIPIDTPLDLTPSLLLGMLESILQSRLPISAAIRKSRDLQSKIQAMKVFVGVLENDVLRQDVGLSDVDPRKLAQGEWDEVVFVGELLCWLGKKHGIIPVVGTNAGASSSRQTQEDASQPQTRRRAGSSIHTRVHTPSPTTHSTVTTRDSMNSTLSMMPAPPPESDTTVLSVRPDSPSLSVLDLFESNATPILEEVTRIRRGLVTPPPRHAPQCIHEIHEPSFMNLPGHFTSIEEDPDDTTEPLNSSDSICHCHPDEEELTPTSTRAGRPAPVRYTGWINRVDDELEVRSFEESRPKPRRDPRTPTALVRSTQSDPERDLYAGITSTSTPRRPATGKRISTRPTSPTDRTLALLNERAKLMAELATIKAQPMQRAHPR